MVITTKNIFANDIKITTIKIQLIVFDNAHFSTHFKEAALSDALRWVSRQVRGINAEIATALSRMYTVTK